ncbi:MAG: class I SAM-dependent methyltransferase [Hydrogenophaga sp.]|uniref:class I SAM-dependent methyltransferase n=1 Tax=Hydrogenophaga sp. TaxID=1904254 RepID=UPI001D591BD4|nr:class I SAM-dependent methyltransferase [Hydrogenophaga sp.]MBX3609969.1 class I SAM-dependent methyltransferase [Hydrogenophaga sp.]
MHGTETPSAWVMRWSHLVPAQGTVLDVACGHGRHLKWFAQHGHSVCGVDRDPEAIAAVRSVGRALQADIENGPWPLAGERFAGVVVTNYLWRPLMPAILDSVAPGGALIYETFAIDHASVGRPSRADFLLRPGELLTLAQGLRVVAYEDGFCEGPDRFVQRLAAVREIRSDGAAPPRHRLDAAG